mgnify:CR=1 FL=1
MTDRYALHLVTAATKVYVPSPDPTTPYPPSSRPNPAPSSTSPPRRGPAALSAASRETLPSRSCDYGPSLRVRRHLTCRRRIPGVDGFRPAVAGADDQKTDQRFGQR